jgi:hypothetical protein
VNDRNWAGELSNYLQQSYLRLPQGRSTSELRINPPLATEEAKYFLLGLENELFDTAEQESSSASDRPELKIFSQSSPAHLVRENICQFATFSLLILQRGWLPHQIEMGEHLEQYGIDMTVKSAAGQIYFAVEVKRSAHELQKFASDFQQCCRRRTHAKADCAFQQNHGVYEFCERYQPKFLWAVAPDDDLCFKLDYGSGTIALEQLNALPRRSHIEFG